MKKLLSAILSLILVCSMAGCGKTPTETSTPTQTTSPEATVPETTVSPDTLAYLRVNLPVMDGSTSLIPLEAGIRAAIFGKSIEEATADVRHSTTWGSFYNLLNGQADLIFSVPLSAEQNAQAQEFGVALEAVPIALEGFVFVVNAENPVDSLTQQQLRDIYSGKITNWSQVGGLDEAIIPYQRNSDSGSQNYMVEFMGDTPLMDAPTELRPASMSGLMDVIAVNDNSRAAIGYSVYAYAADMYGNGNEIKFIQVDGVDPSKATFSDRTYPLMGNNYAIFNAAQPEDSPVRALVAWMLTTEGQTAIAQAGYVTVMDIGYDYSEATLDKYEGTGTGPAAGDVPSSEYAMIGTGYNFDGSPYETDTLTPTVVELENGTKTYRITQLADQALQAEINAWIDQQMVWVAEEKPVLNALLDTLNTDDQYMMYEYGLLWSSSQPDGMDAACIVTAKNGYLSVAVSLCYTYNVMDGYFRGYHTETATWDLLTGQRLNAEDLFCRGVDIDGILNEYIREYTLIPDREFSDRPDMKQDFVALTTGGWHVTHDAIYIDYGDPYFAQGVKIELDELPDGTLVTEQLRDFGACFDPSGDCSVVRQFRISDRDIYYQYTSDKLFSCGLLKEDVHPNAAAINAEVMSYLDTYYTEDAIRGYFADLGYDPNSVDGLYMGDWYLENWGGKYLCFRGSSPVVYTDDAWIYYPYESSFLYDLETGEKIQWQDLLQEGWEQAVVWYDDLVPPDMDAVEVDNFFLNNGHSLHISYTDGTNYFYASIPADYIRY